MISTKSCNRCGEEKSVEEYYKDRHKSDGLRTICKPCTYLPSDSDWEMNKKLRAEAIKLGKNICSTCKQIKDLSEFYVGENRCKPCCVKRANTYNRETRTGWTEEEYLEAYANQNGRCAICKEPSEMKALAADHCHKTHTKRGLLCSECNLLLGKAKDDPKILMSAIEYLLS